MNIFQAVSRVFKNAFNFSGRARRREYWLFCLFNCCVIPALAMIAAIFSMDAGDVSLFTGSLLIPTVYSFFAFLPTLAVIVRRLHDTGKSGAFLLFVLIPIVGEILLLVWLLQDGDIGDNRYGKNPKTNPISDPPFDSAKSPESAPLPVYIDPPKPPKRSAPGWRCSCGKVNSQTDSFCSNCGCARAIKSDPDPSIAEKYVNRYHDPESPVTSESETVHTHTVDLEAETVEAESRVRINRGTTESKISLSKQDGWRSPDDDLM